MQQKQQQKQGQQSPCSGSDLGKQPAENHHNQHSCWLTTAWAFDQILQSVVAEGWKFCYMLCLAPVYSLTCHQPWGKTTYLLDKVEQSSSA